MSGEQQRRGLLADVTLGIEAEAFLAGGVGRFLVSRAEAEIAEAVEALKIINPHDTASITTLQTRIYRAESVQQWLAECIQVGWNAEKVLQQMDE